MADKFVLHDESVIQAVVSEMYDRLEQGQTPIVKFSDRRSNDANSQVWVWVPLIAKFMGWTLPETNQELKLDHGLPIILADETYGPQIKFMLDGVKFFQRPREQQLKILEIMPVTRLFSTKQHKAYRDSIEVHFVRQGLFLEYLEKND